LVHQANPLRHAVLKEQKSLVAERVLARRTREIGIRIALGQRRVRSLAGDAPTR
jgi:hypothetical protein